MFSPFSYDIQFGLKQIFNPKTTKDSLALTLKTGIGEAYNLTHSAKLYVMTVPNIAYGGGIKENGYLGFGLRAGLYYNNKNFRFNTYAEQNYTTSSIYTSATYTIEASYSLSQNLNLYTSYTHQDTSYHSNKETTFGLKLNF